MPRGQPHGVMRTGTMLGNQSIRIKFVMETKPSSSADTPRAPWARALWLVCGGVALTLGVVGVALPLLPTTPFVLLAAFCFSRGSKRYEHWLLTHPRFGPLVHDWRTTRSVPLRAKQLAWAMMAISSAVAWWVLPPHVRWLPGACCAVVAVWLWSLPKSPPKARMG